ncbi:MAG: hypothetical protein GWN62_35305, partial [Aliifodinibius sp.]|nr:hypothetical protein [Fodinibius sp.]
MKLRNILLFVVVFLGSFLIYPSWLQADQPNQQIDDKITYEELFDQLMGLTPEPSQMCNVNNFSFQRD